MTNQRTARLWLRCRYDSDPVVILRFLEEVARDAILSLEDVSVEIVNDDQTLAELRVTDEDLETRLHAEVGERLEKLEYAYKPLTPEEKERLYAAIPDASVADQYRELLRRRQATKEFRLLLEAFQGVVTTSRNRGVVIGKLVVDQLVKLRDTLSDINDAVTGDDDVR